MESRRVLEKFTKSQVLILSLILATFFGCGSTEQTNSPNDVLATIDTYKITTQDFYNRLNVFGKLPEERKRKEFDKIVQNKADYVYGLLAGTEKDFPVKLTTVRNLKTALVEKGLYKAELQKFVPEEEIKEFYEKRKVKVNIAHILVDTKELAQEIRQKIIDGADFTELAAKYSKDTTTAKNGGEIGEFVWGEMVDGFQEAAFELQPDVIPEPVQSAYGFHVMKLLSRHSTNLKSYDEERDKLFDELLRAKSYEIAEYLNEYAAKIDREAQFKTDSVMVRKLHKEILKNLANPSQEAKDYFNDPTTDLAPEWLDTVLMTYNKPNVQTENVPPKLYYNYLLEDIDGNVTVKDLLVVARRENRKAVFEKEQGIYDAIMLAAKQDLFVARALNEGFATQKEFLDLGDSVFEDLIFKQVRRNNLGITTAFTDEEVADYYEKNKENYKDGGWLELRQISVKDEIQGNIIVQRAKDGEKIETILKDLQIKDADVKIRTVPRDAKLDVVELAQSYRAGEAFGPLEAKNGLEVFYIVKKVEPDLIPFEKIKNKVGNDYQNEKKKIEEKKFRELVEKNVKIEVNEEALQKAIANYVEKDDRKNKDIEKKK